MDSSPRAVPGRLAVVVMGVSGSGKSTVGAGIADALGLCFIDGDGLHSAENVARMQAGIALGDDDRWPWLDRIGARLADAAQWPRGVVVACSALKRVYRDRLRAAAPGVRFVFLDGPAALIESRMARRAGHYMPQHPAREPAAHARAARRRRGRRAARRRRAAGERGRSPRRARLARELMAEVPLTRYRQKRDFKVTTEPAGAASAAPATGALSFVIQKHWASRLHYDFRLELDGVLVSWAVPKGPSFDPKKMQMAIHVEDHPLDYGSFEGTIPKKQYGAGTVIVWDRGTWEPVGDARAGLAAGKLVFKLHGEKLAGLWELVRIAKPGDRQEPWMLFKKKDEWARTSAEYDVIAALPDSVVAQPLGLLEAREPARRRCWRGGRRRRRAPTTSRPPSRRRCRPSSSRSSRR